MYVYFSCPSSDEEFLKALDAAEMVDEDSSAIESSPIRMGPDPWERDSILSVVDQYGQPTEEPHEIGERVVGLHYGGLNMQGSPLEVWYWFFEGKTIYSAMEYFPVGGYSDAVGLFETLRNNTLEGYGAPDENLLDEDGFRQRIIWRHGSLALAITLVEGDGRPLILVETYDTEHLDKIGTDLRPSSIVPKRYDPPPPDSGKDRRNLTPEVAEG